MSPQPQLTLGTYPASGLLCLNRLAYLGRWEEFRWGVRWRQSSSPTPCARSGSVGLRPCPSSSFCKDPGILLTPGLLLPSPPANNRWHYQAWVYLAWLADRYHQGSHFTSEEYDLGRSQAPLRPASFRANPLATLLLWRPAPAPVQATQPLDGEGSCGGRRAEGGKL